MTSEICYFLLVFDRAAGKLLQEQHFEADVDKAVAEYGRLEDEHRDSPMMDVVLIGSDSIETVRVTHANYFDGIAPVSSKYLVGL